MSDSSGVVVYGSDGLGGYEEKGTASKPFRTDPTGSTAQPVSGSVTATQATGTNLHTVVDSGSITVTQATGSNLHAVIDSGSLTVSGTVTANAGTGNFDENLAQYGGSTVGASNAIHVQPGTGASFTVAQVTAANLNATVTGTVTANIGTSGSLALDATLTGGTAKSIVRGGAKGTTVAADVTSTAEGADHQALDVQIMHGGSAKDPTQIRALTSSDSVTAVQGTAAALSSGWPVKVTDGTNTLPTMDVAARAGFHQITDGTNTAAVKAASTSPTTTDPALVVAISPNTAPISDRIVTGSLTGTGSITISAQGCGNVGCQITGTWAGTLVFEGSVNGSNWFPITFYQTGGAPFPILTTTTNVSGRFVCSGFYQVRVRCSVYTSGTIIVVLEGSIGSSVTRSAIEQSVVASAGNSSTANLAASATFTGTAENTMGIAGIQVHFKADQPCTIQVQQSIDATNWDISDSYSLAASTGDGRTFQATSNYCRVLVTNTGASTTTYLRLGVAYCPIVEAVPRALDSNGNFKVAITGTGGGNSQKVEVVDAAGTIVDVAEDATPAGTSGLMIVGYETAGNKGHRITCDSVGRLITAPAGTSSTSRGFADGQVVLSATTVVPIRKTTYTEPTSNAQRSIASSSANDTSAGTGARQVKITYFTATLTGPFTETVTLNGTTAVNTVSTTICFIERIEVMSVGSTGSNVGIITLYGSTGGAGGTVWTIAATDNKTFGAHHYIITGQTCYITGVLFGIKGADTTTGFLRAKDPTVATAPEIQISDSIRAPSSGQSFRSYGTPIVVVGPSRVTAFSAPDSSSSRTYYASFDFYEQAT